MILINQDALIKPILDIILRKMSMLVLYLEKSLIDDKNFDDKYLENLRGLSLEITSF